MEHRIQMNSMEDGMPQTEQDRGYDWSDPRTFFLPPEAWGETCSLEGDDAHHLLRVLRLREGEDVRLLDGQGREGAFRIERCGRNQVTLRQLDVWTHPRPQSGLILAPAWTKAARRSWIFEKSVEFGAAAIWFWQAERSQFPVPEEPKDTWHAQLIAGVKQCHNPWLPALRTLPGGVRDLIAAADAGQISQRHVLLENTLGPSRHLEAGDLARPGMTLCVIGPEGGFAPREAEALKDAGFAPFSLGERVLRWGTAAVLCMGLHWWQAESAAGPAAV